MDDMISQLEQLFKETGRAHHNATGGPNVDWAIWYADYIFDRLPAVLGKELPRSELIYTLMWLSKNQEREAPDQRWPAYYAAYFKEHFA